MPPNIITTNFSGYVILHFEYIYTIQYVYRYHFPDIFNAKCKAKL